MPAKRNKTLSRLILPLFAVGLTAGLCWISLYTVAFPSPDSGTIFFPAVLIAQTRAGSNFLFMGVIVGFLAILARAKMTGSGWGFVLTGFVIGSLLIVYSIGASFLASDITPIESLTFQRQTYHLLNVWGTEIQGYSSSPVEAYTIVKCDIRSFFCEYESTPYLRDAFKEYFDDGGRLVIKENALFLQVGEEVYSLEDDVLMQER